MVTALCGFGWCRAVLRVDLQMNRKKLHWGDRLRFVCFQLQQGKTGFSIMRVGFSTAQHGLKTKQYVPIQALSTHTRVHIGLGFALLGIVLGTIGGLLGYNTHKFVQNAERTEGTVVAIGERRNSEGDRVKYPVIEFTDQQGGQHEFKASSGSSSSGYSVGNKVQILYDRERPDSASLDNWLDLYFGPLVLVILAAGSLFFAVAFLSSRSKNREDGTAEEPAPL